jgi:hypothetical protein
VVVRCAICGALSQEDTDHPMVRRPDAVGQFWDTQGQNPPVFHNRNQDKKNMNPRNFRLLDIVQCGGKLFDHTWQS